MRCGHFVSGLKVFVLEKRPSVANLSADLEFPAQ
jgi:hypothetical protein